MEMLEVYLVALGLIAIAYAVLVLGVGMDIGEASLGLIIVVPTLIVLYRGDPPRPTWRLLVYGAAASGVWVLIYRALGLAVDAPRLQALAATFVVGVVAVSAIVGPQVRRGLVRRITRTHTKEESHD